jgi:HPt (histidine-containing phosphotransfer) domain-containing protein
LKQAEHSFQRGDFDPAALKNALAQVHKLAGGLGTFGYGNASEVAAALEQLLIEQIDQQNQWVEQFSVLLKQLNQELESSPEPENPCLSLVESGQKAN